MQCPIPLGPSAAPSIPTSARRLAGSGDDAHLRGLFDKRHELLVEVDELLEGHSAGVRDQSGVQERARRAAAGSSGEREVGDAAGRQDRLHVVPLLQRLQAVP
jgi:hypothetical protein